MVILAGKTPSQNQHSSLLTNSIKTSVIKTGTPRNATRSPWTGSEDQSSITDNLLDLPKREKNKINEDLSKSSERAKASDFF